jgi:hypothetical protein
LTNSKTKTKDQGNSKFLQRIAGKKALGPPPTPRPIIGEHPVRTLLRENADKIEEIKSEATIQAETLSSITSVSDAPEEIGRAPRITGELRASNTNVIGHLKSGAGGVGGELVEPDQKLQSASTEKLNTSKGTERANALKTRTGLSESASAFSRAEENIINIRKKYRLNSGEFSLYRELYLMTHAIGETECSFVVSELVKSTGMLERRVRDNLRRLKKNGWLVLVEGYDFENREKAKYRVNTEPDFS